MKREEVYNFITDYSESAMDTKDLDKKYFAIAKKMTEKSNRKIIDGGTGGVYKSKSNVTVELLVSLVISVLGILFLPWSILINAIISVMLVLVFEFIFNKGLTFLYCDLCNLFQKECKIKYKHKLRYNKFEPVIFGYDKDSNINVIKFNDENRKSLKYTKYYITDKETLGSFLKSYRDGQTRDLATLSYKIVRNLEQAYGQVYYTATTNYTVNVAEQMKRNDSGSASKSNSLS